MNRKRPGAKPLGQSRPSKKRHARKRNESGRESNAARLLPPQGRRREYDDTERWRWMAELIVRKLVKGRDGGVWAAAESVAVVTPGQSRIATAKRLREGYKSRREDLEADAAKEWVAQQHAYLADPEAPLRNFLEMVKALAKATSLPFDEVHATFTRFPSITWRFTAPYQPWFPPPVTADFAQVWAQLLPPNAYGLLRLANDPRRTHAAEVLRNLASLATTLAGMIDDRSITGWPLRWPDEIRRDAEEILEVAQRVDGRKRPK
jgi:hypothetical protein